MSLKRSWYFFALFVFVMVVQYPFLGDPVGANTTTRFALVEGIVDLGTTRIDARHEQIGDKSFVDGHYYSDKAPGMAFLGLAPYWVVSRAQEALGLSPSLFVADDGAVPDMTGYVTQKFTILMTSGVLLAGLAVMFFRLVLGLFDDRRNAFLATMIMAFGHLVLIATPVVGPSRIRRDSRA